MQETEPNDSVTTYDSYGNAIKTEQGFVTRTVKKTYEIESTESSGEETTEPTEDSSTNTSGNLLGNKYIYQNVKVGRAGVMFNVAGQAQAKSIPLSNENRTYGIALNIYYKNSTVPETHYQEFNSATSRRQSINLTVTPENTDEIINYVAIAFVYGYNSNTMTAYSAELNIAPTGYSNDDNTSADNGGANESGTDEDNYTDYEVISESVDKTKTYMQTSAKYDSTGNYAASETDEAGNTVSYTYDANGNTTSVTDAKGNVVKCTYNLNDSVKSVSSNGAQNSYTYNIAENISAIDHNGFSYKFNYDVFNNLISTKIGNTEIVSNTYSPNNGNLIKTTFANGDYFEYSYDTYDNITRIKGENGVIASFVYNKKGLVAVAIDDSSGVSTYYYYDFNGNLTGEYRQTKEGELSYYLSYDSDGNRVEKTSVNGQTKTITSGTDSEGNSFVSNDGVTAKTVTDDFGRITEVKTSREKGISVYNTTYEYASGSAQNSTTNLVKSLTQKFGNTQLLKYEYKYDSNGNITRIEEGGEVVAMYWYDELNQLVSSSERDSGLYTVYSYDKAGNITNVKEYELDLVKWYPLSLIREKTYKYTDGSWKDKLTSYNGTNITYDKIGNPLTYRDGMTMTWENGRQLSTLKTGENEVSYKYDSNGLRTQKEDDNGTTYYHYDSNKNLIGLTKGYKTLYFYYDSQGSPISFSYNGEMYYYVKNLQGDIVKVINKTGVLYARYEYDAFGKILYAYGDPIISALSPFRYRGYVYDTETGLYYLQSRYYDPVTGRFLNADDTAFIGATGTVLSTNLFTYCENNSIKHIDKFGNYFYSRTTISYEKIELRIYRSGKTKKCEVYFKYKCNVTISSIRFKSLSIKKNSKSTTYKSLRATRGRYRQYEFPASKNGQIRICKLEIPVNQKYAYVSLNNLQVYCLKNNSGWLSCATFSRSIKIT